MNITRREGETTPEFERRKADVKRHQAKQALADKERRRKEIRLRKQAERRGTGGRGSRRGNELNRRQGGALGEPLGPQRSQMISASTEVIGNAIMENLRKWINEAGKSKPATSRPQQYHTGSMHGNRPKGKRMSKDEKEERKRIAASMARTFGGKTESRRVTQRANRSRDLVAGSEGRAGDTFTARTPGEEEALQGGGVKGLAIHRGRAKKRFANTMLKLKNLPAKTRHKKRAKSAEAPKQKTFDFAESYVLESMKKVCWGKRYDELSLKLIKKAADAAQEDVDATKDIAGMQQKLGDTYGSNVSKKKGQWQKRRADRLRKKLNKRRYNQ